MAFSYFCIITGMEEEKQQTAGLDEATTDEAPGSEDWNRDEMLIQLETRLSGMKLGAFSSYGKYILPIAFAFTVSGGLIFIAINISDQEKPIPLLLTGNLFVILGIISIVTVLMLIAFDKFRKQHLESYDLEKLSEFECKHFLVVEENSTKIPKCGYFNKDLEEDPFCIICPVYTPKDQSAEDQTP